MPVFDAALFIAKSSMPFKYINRILIFILKQLNINPVTH